MANLRGSIGPNGYVPPANVTVTWRRPGAPDITKKLNPAVKFTNSGDDSVYRRYGEGDQEVKGRQITAIGSEQLGGRAWLILKELYAQAGIDRVPPQIGEETWDFAIAEVGSKPADWCDYKRFTGKPDPICGENCPPCSGGGGKSEPIAPGQVVPTPENLRLTGRVLDFEWSGEGIVNFTLYRGEEGQPLTLLKRGRSSPLVMNEVQPPGTHLMLYADQRKKKASAAQMIVGAEVPPVEPPPIPPPVDPVEPPPPVDPIEPPVTPPAFEIRANIEILVDGVIVATYKLVKV